MMLHIACDVCRRAYQLDEARLGSTLTCKECSVPFEVCGENAVDPDTPDPAPDDGQPQPSEWAQVWACLVNGIGAVAVIVALVAMIVLLFRDPRGVPERPSATSADRWHGVTLVVDE
jgi:hypothetical protein